MYSVVDLTMFVLCDSQGGSRLLNCSLEGYYKQIWKLSLIFLQKTCLPISVN